MIRLEDNIQNGMMVPKILHIPNENGSIDGLDQIALPAESCYQRITHLLESVLSTKGFYNHDNIIMLD
jgi:hypothetical protein